jgi:hypothetical protein
MGQTPEERKTFLFFKLIGARRAREAKHVLDKHEAVLQIDSARFKVAASLSGYYDVVYDFNKKKWDCGCVGYKNRGTNCKHCDAVKAYLLIHGGKVDLY